MIGYYDYTVILTYLSLISACVGVMVSLNDGGHPFLGALFLMICGLCDAFDGTVARSKKNRTEKEKEFGVQIDSLSDLVAFGVLPTCIGMALYKRDHFMGTGILAHIPYIVIVLISAAFVLCALIRLAYFNITVEETQGNKANGEKFYFGLPVTSVSLIFPACLLLIHFFESLSFLYYILLVVVAMLFIVKFRLKKPTIKEVCMMVAFGAIEFLIVVAVMIWMRRR